MQSPNSDVASVVETALSTLLEIEDKSFSI